MRCERCGRELTNTMFTINGTVLCEQCAKNAGFYRGPSEFLNNPFVELDAIASTFREMAKNEIDFGNSTLTCPKCGMTLKEFENEGHVGCIECYNTFNENIIREMFKQQGNSEYTGRLPSQSAGTVTESPAAVRKQIPAEGASPDDGPAAAPVPGPAEPKKEHASGLTIEKLMKADLGMLSDEELEKGIKLAADAEEYILASKLRDELKGRKDGGSNG